MFRASLRFLFRYFRWRTLPHPVFLKNLYRPVFDRLATDGWIEEVPASGTQLFETWLTAHDVLADQILLSYLRSIPNTVEKLVSELFSLAAETGCLTSAIVSLQRNADTPPLSALPWSKVIIESIAASQLLGATSAMF